MPRKKIEPITSLGNEDKLTVQKSLPLFALWRSDLTLPEFKILDIYLSRIDSHKPEKRAVVFEKGELETILGVQKINNKDLILRLKRLMSNVVELPDSSMKKGVRLVTLFEEAVAEQDEDGLWKVRLECTQKAMKYFFNIENLGYLRYKLRCITSLTSRYTYIMFIYLESNRYRKSWEIGLEDLKKVLDCDTEEYAKEFKYFNRDVLKRIHKEMHEKTECRYTYTPVKKGRSVVAIRFTLETLSSVSKDQIPGQMSLDDIQGQGELWETVLKDSGFSLAQMEQLRAVIQSIPDNKLPDIGDGIEIDRYHYVQQKWTALQARSEKKTIKNKFSYLLKMIDQDIK